MSLLNNISAGVVKAFEAFGGQESRLTPPVAVNEQVFTSLNNSPQDIVQNDLILRGIAGGFLTSDLTTASQGILPQNYATPIQTSVNESDPFARLVLPRNGGQWTGERGNSDWRSTSSAVNRITGGQPVPFRNGFPEFDQWVRGTVRLSDMRGTQADFDIANRLYAMQQGWYRPDGQPDARRVEQMMRSQNLVWHHHQDERRMQLVPRELNRLSHLGGAAMSRNNSHPAIMNLLRAFGFPPLGGGRE